MPNGRLGPAPGSWLLRVGFPLWSVMTCASSPMNGCLKPISAATDDRCSPTNSTCAVGRQVPCSRLSCRLTVTVTGCCFSTRRCAIRRRWPHGIAAIRRSTSTGISSGNSSAPALEAVALHHQRIRYQCCPDCTAVRRGRTRFRGRVYALPFRFRQTH